MKKKFIIYFAFSFLLVGCFAQKKHDGKLDNCESIIESKKDSIKIHLKNISQYKDTIKYKTDSLQKYKDSTNFYKVEHNKLVERIKELYNYQCIEENATNSNCENELNKKKEIIESLQLKITGFKLIQNENEDLKLELERLRKKVIVIDTAKQKEYASYIVDLKKNGLTFFWKDDHKQKIKSIESLLKYLRKDNKTLLFATNGGMYKSDNSPQGLYIENNDILQNVDREKNGYGNFYIQPNGIFLIKQDGSADIIKTSDYEKYKNKNKIKYATQSGPLLLYDDNINSNFTVNSPNKLIRSGVGIINNKKVIFIISNVPISFYDFALIFRDKYSCKTALYLDGVVSQMYAPEIERYDIGGNFGVLISIIK